MVIDRIYQWARSQPKKTAIINDDISIDYASFSCAIDAARRFLEPHALTAAGRTAIVFANSLSDAWVLLLALRSLGLNTIYLQSIEDVEKLKLRDVAFVVSHPRSRPKHLVGIEGIVVPTTIYGHASEVPVIQPNNPPFGGHIIYTSGTTGSFKKLLPDSRFDDRSNETRARIHHFSKNTIIYETAQPSRGTGARAAPAVWHVGGCVVYDDRPDPLSRIFRHGVNSLKLTPWTSSNLLRSLDTSGPMDHDIELFIGAGFLSVTLAEEVMNRLTRRLVITYGASEVSVTPLFSRFTAIEDMHWLAPADGRTIEIVDENGNLCQEGELRILLTEIDCTSYLDDEEASAKVFRNGFFYPGDIAVRRADGRIRILGRVDDVVNVQGIKYPVALFEHGIQQLLGLDAVCVFSGPNAAGNEELAVAVETSRLLWRSELEAVARYCAPLRLRVRVAVFNEFPRTETGKTRRSVVKKLVFERQAWLPF
jgi:acyl-coenzyme A synthetase/AMP-(fatty) acid ligase